MFGLWAKNHIGPGADKGGDKPLVVHFSYEDGEVTADKTVFEMVDRLRRGGQITGELYGGFETIPLTVAGWKYFSEDDGSINIVGIDANDANYGDGRPVLLIRGYYEGDEEWMELNSIPSSLDLYGGYDLVLRIKGSLESRNATVTVLRGTFDSVYERLFWDRPVRVSAIMNTNNGSRPQSLLVTGVQYTSGGGPGGSGTPQVLVGLLQFGGLDEVYAYTGDDPETADLKKVEALMDLSHYAVLAIASDGTTSWK